MNDGLRQLQIGNTVRVSIANVYEYGTVTTIETNSIFIKLTKEPCFTREITFQEFIDLNFEIVTE